ncbi:MAG: endonuclease/exonuclease/phosphatase family protein [Aeromonas sp.]
MAVYFLPLGICMIRFATFNVAFDRPQPEILSRQLALTRSQQDALLARLDQGRLKGAQHTQARQVRQMRNVAEIIQRTRPDVLLLNEFDNDGQGDVATGDDSCTKSSECRHSQDLAAFNDHYLAHPQHPDVTAIHYPVRQSFATNTGLMSGYDLNLDGKVNSGPEDGWGFGSYHGQYAFAVMSIYPIAAQHIRTFQHFKWQNMPGEQNPIIDTDLGAKSPLPPCRQRGEPWYHEAAWQQHPLSSKNHVDLPLLIPTPLGDRCIHLLISHPTPPIFANAARHSIKRNRAEIAFWNDYINGLDYMTDDQGVQGGLPLDAAFVIAGDLNADPLTGDGDRTAIRALQDNPRVNQAVTRGPLIPTSRGGAECMAARPHTTRPYPMQPYPMRPYPERITSSSGLQLDHLMPSTNLTALNSGVYWPASDEVGYHLVHHAQFGIAKGVSSDHRLVWLDLALD